MAERPVFLPADDERHLVKEVFLQLHWHSGFAQIQKEKNIRELHTSASAAGLGPLLEISTKSERVAGRHLSAFHLKVKTESGEQIPLECAFQGSKVFEHGGPFLDLYKRDVRDAKRDSRLKESGRLISFQFEGSTFPLEPKTLFYDWLYVNSIYEHREWLERLNHYAGFTDIEFNPYRSINCQARSIALFLTLQKRSLLDEAIRSPEHFQHLLSRFDYRPQLRVDHEVQKALFASEPTQESAITRVRKHA
jgi:hypothetical protein